MIKINLNPEKKKARGKRKVGIALPKKKIGISLAKKNFIYFAIPVVVLTAEFAYIIFLNIEIKKLENKRQYFLTEKTKYIAAKRQIDLLKRKIIEAEKIKDDVSLKIKIYDRLAKEKNDFGKILVAISTSIPDGIWLTQLNISRQKTDLLGYTFDPKYISLFYKNLQKYYDYIDFKSTERDQKKELIFYSFKFDMKNWKYVDETSQKKRGIRK